MDVFCPICKKNVIWSEASAYRPFCSERCKYQDLSAWATEQYRVDAPITEDDLMSDEDLLAFISQSKDDDFSSEPE
jgi:endogenous inhibitor of DNA gyrase (YacG/DUF329 family)